MRWSSSVKMSVKYQNHRTMIKTDPWWRRKLFCYCLPAPPWSCSRSCCSSAGTSCSAETGRTEFSQSCWGTSWGGPALQRCQWITSSTRLWPRLTIGGGGNSRDVLLLLPGVVAGGVVALLEHLALHGLDGLDPLRPMKVIQSESKILRLTSHLLYFLKITETIINMR